MIALILAAALLISYPQVPARGAMVPPDDCARYVKSACNYWKLATWLPELNGTAPPINVTFVDDFVLRGSALSSGTRFTYGKAGPPRGHAIYDRRNHIALFEQGCCSWGESALAAGVAPPPLRITDHTLSGIQTSRGLHLGMTSEQVARIYGDAQPAPVKGVPGVLIRSYHHTIQASDTPGPGLPTFTPCELNTTLGFYRDRLIYIDFNHGC